MDLKYYTAMQILDAMCESDVDPRQAEDVMTQLARMPSAEPETCEGCKHLGKWENEVEYGYNSPCTGCKRRVNDNYER